MFNKLLQTVLSRRSLSTLRCMRTSNSTTLCRRFNNYNHRLVVTSNFSCYTQIKCKYKDSSKSGKKSDELEDSDEEEDDIDTEDLQETGKKIVTVNAKAMRLDAVVKAGFGMSRNKAEAAFYASKILKNGKKATKKSELIYEGDEIDLVHSTQSPNNPNLMVVSRLLILKISDNNEMYRIKLARDKNLTIESKEREE